MRALLWLLAGSLTLLAQPVDHGVWDRVLHRYVNALGEVNYAALKANRGEFDLYLRQLAQTSPRSAPGQYAQPPERLAYWINAYNALTVEGVLRGYPTKSVRDLGLLGNFFRRKDYLVGGTRMSLDDIEHGILRQEFHEPRIHFAIVCASVGCPFLAAEAYLPSRIEAQLDRQARQFLTQRRNVRLDAAANDLWLNPILKWYGGDFGDVPAFVKRYATGAVQQALSRSPAVRIRFLDYDWSLNDLGSRGRAASPYERELAGKPAA